MNRLVMALCIIFIVAVLGFVVYVLFAYGGKPITEIPSWAVPFFLRK